MARACDFAYCQQAPVRYTLEVNLMVFSQCAARKRELWFISSCHRTSYKCRRLQQCQQIRALPLINIMRLPHSEMRSFLHLRLPHQHLVIVLWVSSGFTGFIQNGHKFIWLAHVWCARYGNLFHWLATLSINGNHLISLPKVIRLSVALSVTESILEKSASKIAAAKKKNAWSSMRIRARSKVAWGVETSKIDTQPFVVFFLYGLHLQIAFIFGVIEIGKMCTRQNENNKMCDDHFFFNFVSVIHFKVFVLNHEITWFYFVA